MIIEYHRPKNIKEALALMNRKEIPTYPLGGGVSVSHKTGENYAVVDLQALGLNKIEQNAEQNILGATVTLQEIVDCKELPETIREAARRETSFNIRQVSTIAGALVKANGKSPLALALMAADTSLVTEPGGKIIPLGEFYALRGGWQGLITKIIVPNGIRLGMELISKTPEDQMIVGAAVGTWPSGRTRIILGGDFATPTMILDGKNNDKGVEIGIKNAYSHTTQPNLIHIDYLKKTSQTLIERLMNS